MAAVDGLHAATGLPWWATICSVGVAVRVAMFPVSLQGMKASAALMPLLRQARDEVAASMRRQLNAAAPAAAAGATQQEEAERHGGGSRQQRWQRKQQAAAAAVAALQQQQQQRAAGSPSPLPPPPPGPSMRQILARFHQLRQAAGAPHPAWALASPLAQLPVFITAMAAIRTMSLSGWPGFSTGGGAWFPDLTLPAMDLATWTAPMGGWVQGHACPGAAVLCVCGWMARWGGRAGRRLPARLGTWLVRLLTWHAPAAACLRRHGGRGAACGHRAIHAGKHRCGVHRQARLPHGGRLAAAGCKAAPTCVASTASVGWLPGQAGACLHGGPTRLCAVPPRPPCSAGGLAPAGQRDAVGDGRAAPAAGVDDGAAVCHRAAGGVGGVGAGVVRCGGLPGGGARGQGIHAQGYQLSIQPLPPSPSPAARLQLPQGALCYWAAGSGLALLQNHALKQPAVRRAVGLPTGTQQPTADAAPARPAPDAAAAAAAAVAAGAVGPIAAGVDPELRHFLLTTSDQAALFDRAAHLRAEGRAGATCTVLQRLLQLYPGQPNALYALGQVRRICMCAVVGRGGGEAGSGLAAWRADGQTSGRVLAWRDLPRRRRRPGMPGPSSASPAPPACACPQVHAALKDWPLSEQCFLQAAHSQQARRRAGGMGLPACLHPATACMHAACACCPGLGLAVRW